MILFPMLLLLSLGSCTQQGSLSVMDPYIAVISPSVKSSYRKASAEFFILGEESMSTVLFSELQSRKPERIFLTPFLASEVPTILSSFPELEIGYIGPAALQEDSRLYSIEFSETRAAVQAGILIADFCGKLSPEPVAIAVILPEETAGTLSEAFIKGFREAGGTGTPYVLGVAQEFSSDAVSSLKSVDIRAAFIAVPGSAGSQYKRHLFTQATYIVELQPVFFGNDGLSDVVLSWDFQRALDAIRIRMETKKPGKEYLSWKESK